MGKFAKEDGEEAAERSGVEEAVEEEGGKPAGTEAAGGEAGGVSSIEPGVSDRLREGGKLGEEGAEEEPSERLGSEPGREDESEEEQVWNHNERSRLRASTLSFSDKLAPVGDEEEAKAEEER